MDGRRWYVARDMFRDFVGVTTHPDLLAAMWGNLSREDKQYWLDRADEHLGEGGDS